MITTKTKKTEKIVSRFAPSPTGFLHIGNARTAIFNWLLSRHYGGKFYIRIEDTDRQRFSQEAVDVIFQSLQFLNLDWDNPDTIIYQSTRNEQYVAAVKKLLDSNLAYKCFHTIEELETLKTANNQAAFRSQWRDRDDHPTDKEYVVRLKIPTGGDISFTDDVQGELRVENQAIEDFVLLRSDGTPTYMLAVVVDDHDMEITYVLRGSDHLTNTFKQLHLFKAFGWAAPTYAHIPLIHDISGQKLSKRHGAVGVLEYAEKGVLPEALFNYLMKLGWGYKDEEFIPLKRALEIFTEQGFGKSAARFDEKKLLDLSAQYLRKADDLLQRAKDYYQNYIKLPELDDKSWARFEHALPQIMLRAQTLSDLIHLGQIFFHQAAPTDIEVETIPYDKLTNFFTPSNFDNNLEQNFRSFCTENNMEFKTAASWLRKKLTGRQVSPGLFEVMNVLGAELCLIRIKA